LQYFAACAAHSPPISQRGSSAFRSKDQSRRANVDGNMAPALHFGQVVRPILTWAGEVSIEAPDIAMQQPAMPWPLRFFAGII
jgi:hypothetical protein